MLKEPEFFFSLSFSNVRLLISIVGQPIILLLGPLNMPISENWTMGLWKNFPFKMRILDSIVQIVKARLFLGKFLLLH